MALKLFSTRLTILPVVVLLQSAFLPTCFAQGDPSRQFYGVTPRRVELIPPGTVIDKGPPAGWSHLIIKSHPRPVSGDMSRAAGNNYYLATFLFTGFLANVQADQTGGQLSYRLTRIAVGFGTRIQGRDTIISPDTQRRLGANLGFLARMVLDHAYEGQQGVIITALTPTLGIVDCPVAMLRGDVHRTVYMRYVLLVDPATGRLDTFMWLLDRDNEGRYVGPSSHIQWMPPNKIEDAVMHVDSNEYTLGMPSDIAFAIIRIPQGQKQIIFPDDLKTAAIQPRFTAEGLARMELRLRQILVAVAASR
jgi:hypothetical protein